MSTEENKAAVHRFLEEVIHRRNVAAVDEYLAPDYVEHDALPPGMPPGREGLKQLVAMFLEAFPDLRLTIDEEVAEGDRVALYHTFTGTHQGTFMGIAPTGKQVSFTTADFVRIVDGKQVEHRSVIDTFALLQQLGALPALGQ